MDPTPPSRPEPIRWQNTGFAFGSFGFMSGQYGRESVDTLRKLASEVGAVDDQQELMFKRTWLIAQFNHYGLRYRRACSVSDLRDALMSTVKAGKCDAVPDFVSHIEKDLEDQWESISREYEQKLEQYNQDMAIHRNQVFSQLGSPTDEAEYSLDSFFHKYFLDDIGQPDRTKTLHAIALPGYSGTVGLFHAMRRSQIGLESDSGGSATNRTLCIGWDRNSVCDLARQYDAEAQQIALHVQPNKTSTTDGDHLQEQSPLVLNCLTGSYIVTCEALSSQYKYEEKSFTIDIAEPYGDIGVAAAFNFGYLQGTMLMALSESDLNKFVDEEEAEENSDSSEIDDDETESVDDEQDELDIKAELGDQVLVQLESSSGIKRNIDASDLDDAPDSKKQKIHKTINKRRVYFQWRGREMGEGEIQLPAGDDHRGIVEFDDTMTSFSGSWDAGLVAEIVPISGTKISDIPNNGPGNWSDFSESAWEQACVGRWG